MLGLRGSTTPGVQVKRTEMEARLESVIMTLHTFHGYLRKVQFCLVVRENHRGLRGRHRKETLAKTLLLFRLFADLKDVESMTIPPTDLYLHARVLAGNVSHRINRCRGNIRFNL